MRVSLVSKAVPAAAVLVAAVLASAHETSGIIEIAAIDARVDAQLDATSGREHRAYAALAKIIRRPSRASLGLTDDVTKLIATLAACGKGPLATDAVLRDALADPETQCDTYLTNAPDGVSVAARRLERASDRASVQRALDASAAAHVDAIAHRDAADERGMLLRFRKAGSQLARAGRLVQTFLARQVRRKAPGQPLAKGPKGTIDTYAGTGVAGFSGDGGLPLNATFYFPMDVAVEPATGLVHICDFNNHRIRRIDADGKVRTIAGSGDLGDTEGPALTAKLHHPASIAFGPTDGLLYIAGWHVHRIIRLLEPSNVIEHYAGTGDPGNTGDDGPVTAATFNYPASIAFGAAGDWYVSDQNNNRVRHVDASGAIHAFAGTGVPGFFGDDGPALAAQLANTDGDVDGPTGRSCLDPTEKFVYVADTSNHRVRRVDVASGVITTFAGTGDVGAAGDGGPATSASLDTPVDVDCDADGNVYVCDREQDVIRRIDVATNVISRYAGIAGIPHDGSPTTHYAGDGQPATSARLNRPQGIFVDRVRGRLYVADTLNNVIRVVWE
jgi:DNA-binding beta-propeller fold protein YncE